MTGFAIGTADASANAVRSGCLRAHRSRLRGHRQSRPAFMEMSPDFLAARPRPALAQTGEAPHGQRRSHEAKACREPG